MIGSIDIRRHPVGMVSTFAASCIFIIITAIISFNMFSHTSAIIILILVSIGCISMGYVIDIVYWSNYMVLAEDRLILYLRYSLKNRQAHQISLDEIEDVVVSQRGIIGDFVNFGSLTITLRMGRARYEFSYCDDPSFYAQEILRAKQQCLDTQILRQNSPEPTLNHNDQPIGMSFLSGKSDDEEIEGL